MAKCTVKEKLPKFGLWTVNGKPKACGKTEKT